MVIATSRQGTPRSISASLFKEIIFPAVLPLHIQVYHVPFNSLAPSCSLQVVTLTPPPPRPPPSCHRSSLILLGQMNLSSSESTSTTGRAVSKESQRMPLYFYFCLSGSSDWGGSHSLWLYQPQAMLSVPEDADTDAPYVPLVSWQPTTSLPFCFLFL